MLLMLAVSLRITCLMRGDRKAVTALEYGLIAALIGVAIIGAVTALGTALPTTFNQIVAALPAG